MGDVLDLRTGRPVVAPQKRRPRKVPATFLLRAELRDSEPPIWRELELPSDLPLDQVHEVMQAVFGWEDYHLHRFTLGEPWERGTLLFLCPYDVEEGEDDGEPAAGVRLDELLGQVGDVAWYAYDYGDSWEVALRLVDVRPDLSAPCVVAAHGLAPPEDCGGIHTWNERRKDRPVEPAPLQQALDAAVASWAVPGVVRRLHRRLGRHPSYPAVQQWIDDAGFERAPDLALAGEACDRLAWLVRRVGSGLALTKAGYLPPAVVHEAVVALGVDALGTKGNREDHVTSVRHLRACAQRLGLVRLSKGKLLPTKAGTAVLGDPGALAALVASKTAGVSRTRFQAEAAALMLLGLAAGRSMALFSNEVSPSVVAALHDLGWQRSDGRRIEDWEVRRADPATSLLLDAVGYQDWRRGRLPTDAERELCRAVLRAMT